MSLLYFTRDEFVHFNHGNLILLLRGGCTPLKTGEHGGSKYPKGKVVAILLSFKIGVYWPLPPRPLGTPPPRRRGMESPTLHLM